MSEYTDLVAAERQRQIEVEGWDAEHDADRYHCEGQLAEAACYYAHPADKVARSLWPYSWSSQYAKRDRKSRLRQLVVAGALLHAEYDRLRNVKADDE